MRGVLSIAACALNVMNATAGELPVFEVAGFPISPHQMMVLGPANVQEQLRESALLPAGLSASPVQLSILVPRSQGRRGLSGNEAASAEMPRRLVHTSTGLLSTISTDRDHTSGEPVQGSQK